MKTTKTQAYRDLRAYKNGDFSYPSLLRKYNIKGSFLNTFDRLISEDNFNCKKIANMIA